MFSDDKEAPRCGPVGGPADARLGGWTARVDATELMQIEERRRLAAASMAMFTRLVRQPQRRGEARKLLPEIVRLVEGLYAAEESVLAGDARLGACRRAHRAVLSDLRTSVRLVTTNDGAYDEFELVHAIDALLHEWIVSGRMGAPQPVTLN